MSNSSGVQWRKPTYNFALESLDFSTNLEFPFLTIPVRHLEDIEDGKLNISLGDTYPCDPSRKGRLCIDITRLSASVTVASRCVSIERTYVR